MRPLPRMHMACDHRIMAALTVAVAAVLLVAMVLGATGLLSL